LCQRIVSGMETVIQMLRQVAAKTTTTTTATTTKRKVISKANQKVIRKPKIGKRSAGDLHLGQ